MTFWEHVQNDALATCTQKKQILEPADTKVLEPAQEEATTHGQHGQLELVVHRNEE